MSVGPSWFGRGTGVGGAMPAITLNPALFVPVVITSAVLTGLPQLLITTVTLAAVFSRDPVRRSAAGKTLDRLLTTPSPRRPPIQAP